MYELNMCEKVINDLQLPSKWVPQLYFLLKNLTYEKKSRKTYQNEKYRQFVNLFEADSRTLSCLMIFLKLIYSFDDNYYSVYLLQDDLEK